MANLITLNLKTLSISKTFKAILFYSLIPYFLRKQLLDFHLLL